MCILRMKLKCVEYFHVKQKVNAQSNKKLMFYFIFEELFNKHNATKFCQFLVL